MSIATESAAGEAVAPDETAEANGQPVAAPAGAPLLLAPGQVHVACVCPFTLTYSEGEYQPETPVEIFEAHLKACPQRVPLLPSGPHPGPVTPKPEPMPVQVLSRVFSAMGFLMLMLVLTFIYLMEHPIN